MGTSGGRANEAGSLHRSGFAALLAAYGLRGIPLSFFSANELAPYVASLAFETEDAVDDIRCTMTDGTYAVFQAKRSCGDDKHLAATVQQWVDQLSNLNEKDRVALVVRNPRGPVRDLREALHHNRSTIHAAAPEKIEKAIKAITNHFPALLPDGEKAKLLRAAYCIECKAESPGDDHFDTAVALLDGVVVSTGSGVVAAKVLQRNFQQGAATGLGSTVADWVTWLKDAGLSPQADPCGPPGPKQAAEDQALDNYLTNLQSESNKLHLSLLAEDIPTLHIEGLAGSFNVQSSIFDGDAKKVSLLSLSRRWRRIFLVGLPGSGKSTAVRQVAASWAMHSNAPVPIVVPLKRLAAKVEEANQITLDGVIDVAITNAPNLQRESLRASLRKVADRGNALLILDGLDECRSLSGVVSAGLRSMLDNMHPHTAAIATGRDNSLPAARTLDFPEARLCEPDFLGKNMRELIKQIAKIRLPSEQREVWINEKTRWLEEAERRNSDIWRIPLLATMLTLLISSRHSPILPSGRARILSAVIHDSVRKWEVNRTRLSPPGGWDASLKPAQILDGFVAIGHALNADYPPSTHDVKAALITMLQARWATSIGEAESAAADIQWFWDEQVGVFVSHDSAPKVEARSRQFIEIAEAMWVAWQDQAGVLSWVERAIADDGMEQTASLAAGLSEEVADALLRIASQSSDPRVKARGLRWLLDSQSDRSSLTGSAISSLIHQTCSLYGNAAISETEPARNSTNQVNGVHAIRKREEERRLRVDGFGWSHLVQLARINLPDEFRSIRQSAFSAVSLDSHKRHILSALTALADAQHDGQELNSRQLEAVRSLLLIPIEEPEKTPLRQISRGRFALDNRSEPMITGHYAAALLAINHIGLLGSDALPHLAVVARRGPASTYSRFATSLKAHGFEMSSSWSTPVIRRFVELFGEDDFYAGILEPVASLSDGETIEEMDRQTLWRMPDLVQLLELFGLADVGIGDYQDAISDPHLPDWLLTISRIHGIDVDACARQARMVLDEDEAKRASYDFLYQSMGHPAPSISAVEPEDIEILIEGLQCNSDWLAFVSFKALANMGDSRSIAGLAEVMKSGQPKRRRLAAIAWCVSCSDRVTACGEALSSNDPAVRAGGASLARMIGSTEADHLVALSAADPDMTVRWSATHDKDIAQGGRVWSCSDCAGINERDILDCGNCSVGVRPRMRD